jgi:hypothetical protein
LLSTGVDTRVADDDLEVVDALIDAVALLAAANAEEDDTALAVDEETAGMLTVKIGNVLGVAAAISMDVTDASSSAALR